jgi:hypothetical protein
MSGSEMPFKMPTVLALDPARLTDCGSPNRLLACVELFGARHHLGLIRVREASYREDGSECGPDDDDCKETIQVVYGDDPDDWSAYDDIQWMYEGHYETFKLPDREGDWVAYMHPYDN